MRVHDSRERAASEASRSEAQLGIGPRKVICAKNESLFLLKEKILDQPNHDGNQDGCEHGSAKAECNGGKND